MPQNRTVRARPGQIVYFAQLGSGSIKIGTTSLGVKGRLSGLKYEFGQHVAILATMPGGESREQAIHSKFAHLRFPGTEQFRPARDLMEFIGLPALAAADPRSIRPQPEFYQRTSQKRDLTGQAFGRFIVIHEAERKPREVRRWVCRCECGTIKTVQQDSLLRGVVVSCGCYCREQVSARTKTHGMTGSPEYHAWASMKSRCLNPKNPGYPDYGGRGITVCPEWLESFEAFYRDVGPRPSPKHSLDRMRNDEGYEPGNVRWATDDIQSRNTRRNVLVTYNDETMPLKDWATRLGISDVTLSNRLKRGWTVEEAIETPVNKHEDRSITIDGVTLTANEWARQYGLAEEAVRMRLVRGWDPIEALTTPLLSRRPKRK